MIFSGEASVFNRFAGSAGSFQWRPRLESARRKFRDLLHDSPASGATCAQWAVIASEQQ